jgi:hypothetical protein
MAKANAKDRIVFLQLFLHGQWSVAHFRIAWSIRDEQAIEFFAKKS